MRLLCNQYAIIRSDNIIKYKIICESAEKIVPSGY